MMEYEITQPWRKTRHSNPNGACVRVAGAEVVTGWRKSFRSVGNGACVRVGEVRNWRKAAASFSNGNCVRVGEAERMIAIGDTRDEMVALIVPPGAFREFLARVKDDAALA